MNQHSPVPAPAPRLMLRGITKRYPTILANDGIDLCVGVGEIHAVMGENGAGKSTLMKIVYGVTRPDSGSIEWEGRPTVIDNPAAARRLGIGMVFQHFALFETLSVAENIALALDERMPPAALAPRIRAVAERYGLIVEPERLVHSMSVGERQRVEIVRCLLQSPKLLIMDEPTSVLTPQAVQQLFATLRRLAGEGMSILYISHKLEEIRTLCDSATVLRGGRVSGTARPREESNASLARLMVGTTLDEPPLTAREAGEVRLELKGYSIASRDPFGTALRHIDLAVHAGEIVGIAGVSGNGQKELLAALSGETLGAHDGAISLCGVRVDEWGASARRGLGLGFVPEERLGRGAVPAMTLAENALLTGSRAGMVRHGLINQRAARQFARATLVDFKVKSAGESSPAERLSGGNLQKFIVGREIRLAPRVMLAAQPTWGVDVGAALMIHQALIGLRDAGAAVLVISEELDELFAICDRIAVLSAGRLSPAQARSGLTVEAVGLLMAGAAQPVAAESAHRGPCVLELPWRLEKRAAASGWMRVAAPLIAAAAMLATGFVIFALLGKEPINALNVFFVQPLNSLYGWGELLLKATPLALCALGLALGFSANVWNIGAEGQLILGAVCGSGVALFWSAELGRLALPVILVAGIAGGAAWAAIPAVLRTRFNTSEILVSLMLVYIAELLLSFLLHGAWRDPEGFNYPQSKAFDDRLILPVLIDGQRATIAFPLMLGLAALSWLFSSRLFAGYRMRVSGQAPAAAAYAGFSERRNVWLALLIGGGAAGLAGVCEVMGPIGRLQADISPGYGFAAIIVAFVGRLHPVGIVLAALLMSLLYLGGESVQLGLQLPAAVTGLFQGLLLFYLLAADLFVGFRVRRTPRLKGSRA